jgi:hypothetical protein
VVADRATGGGAQHVVLAEEVAADRVLGAPAEANARGSDNIREAATSLVFILFLLFKRRRSCRPMTSG